MRIPEAQGAGSGRRINQFGVLSTGEASLPISERLDFLNVPHARLRRVRFGSTIQVLRATLFFGL